MTRRKWVVILVVAALLASLVVVGAFTLLGGGSGPGTVTGTIGLTDTKGARVQRLISAVISYNSRSTLKSLKTKTTDVGPSGRFRTSLAPGPWSMSGEAQYVDHKGETTDQGISCSITVVSGQTTKVAILVDVANIYSGRCD